MSKMEISSEINKLGKCVETANCETSRSETSRSETTHNETTQNTTQPVHIEDKLYIIDMKIEETRQNSLQTDADFLRFKSKSGKRVLELEQKIKKLESEVEFFQKELSELSALCRKNKQTVRIGNDKKVSRFGNSRSLKFGKFKI